MARLPEIHPQGKSVDAMKFVDSLPIEDIDAGVAIEGFL